VCWSGWCSARVWIGLGCWALGWGGWWLGVAFAAGWLAHIWGDWLTVSGVPLWWPVTDRRCRSPWPIRTGGPVETRLVRPALLAAAAVTAVLAVAVG
jgi:inner membrane protein